MHRLSLLTMAAVAMTSPALAQPAAPLPPALVIPKPPAPAFKAGTVVVDRDGMRVGQVKTLTESDKGALVVLEIDGKLVGVPEASLKLDGERAISAQTKGQMLAAANAPG